ncbi:IS630 transposase-related protein [Nostoc sp.]|uniref:IS630 transposase-related protein n=1 Tax=Nostoc sp. TaxID=1180 RepID=UPI0035937018
MKAYSLDLRQKIVAPYLKGGISQRHLAKRFRVALSFIEHYRETGNIVPIRIQQTPAKLNEQQLKVLKEIVSANNHATLSEIRND